MLDNFKDLSISSPIEKQQDNAAFGLLDLKASIQPKSVPFEDYDFTMLLRDPVYDGFFGI